MPTPITVMMTEPTMALSRPPSFEPGGGVFWVKSCEVEAGEAVVEQREQDQREPGDAEQRGADAEPADDDVLAAAAGIDRVHRLHFPAFFSSRISISRAAASTKKVSTNSSRPSRIRPD